MTGKADAVIERLMSDHEKIDPLLEQTVEGWVAVALWNIGDIATGKAQLTCGRPQ